MEPWSHTGVKTPSRHESLQETREDGALAVASDDTVKKKLSGGQLT